ncbi:serine/threonine-protein kinase [Micromonospora sediminimaris]|uniref:non-specific serine/threonine protein kinase n=1 Tax=Micromonospora sediminimaris TaxID=547162 RepID=A0A9W5US27_9ACTN|nr:serine/threonine-protein kinase [Micromonospora sediminimaris]GIJ33610.1 serine/threonine protein kinase [Micromonospora sediminimaris]SFC89653.1 Serine/threonine protein kinase [Micromonospora sediminimaris]
MSGREGRVVVAERIGAYRVERLLGVGSFATVWLAYDPMLDLRVAIKVLADNWQHDVRVRERFLEEARLLSRMEDDRLLRVRMVGELADGRPYTVLDWADGGSLRERLAAGPLPVAAALNLLAEIAAGVAVLHRHRVVHRDLSPGNILFRSTADGERVLIADLGLAKALAVASGLTMRAGTPGYMAPEQDDALAIVDERADVYALGQLGLRLLAPPTAGVGPGETVSGGEPIAAAAADVGPVVMAVLRRATAARPADRYQDAEAFRAALLRAARRTRDPIDPGTRPAFDLHPADVLPVPTGASRPPWLRAVALTVVLVAAAGAVAADSATPSGTATSGPLTVALPAGWQAAGTGWAGRYDASGRLEPALVISPEPRRWAIDPSVPGAFLGLSVVARDTEPGTFVAERPHADCAPTPPRQVRRGGLDWVVARFDCPHGRPVLMEAAARGSVGLLYAQVVPPPGAGDEFVDALLDGVRIRRQVIARPP